VKQNLMDQWSRIKPRVYKTYLKAKEVASNPLVQAVWTAAKTQLPWLNLVEQPLQTIEGLVQRLKPQDESSPTLQARAAEQKIMEGGKDPGGGNPFM